MKPSELVEAMLPLTRAAGFKWCNTCGGKHYRSMGCNLVKAYVRPDGAIVRSRPEIVRESE